EAVAARALVDDGQSARKLVLRNDDLFDPIAVQVYRQRHRLGRIDVGPAAPLHLPLHTELDEAAADRGRGAERVLIAERDPQPVVLVDEGQGPRALTRDVAEGRAGRAEGPGHGDSSLVDQTAVATRQ